MRHWKRDKRLQALRPYFNEKQVKTGIRFSRLLMVVFLIGLALYEAKSFLFGRNLLIQSSVTDHRYDVGLTTTPKSGLLDNADIVATVRQGFTTPQIQYQLQTVIVKIPYIITATPEPTNSQFYENGSLVRFRYSYYYPPLGGVNCRTFEDGVCTSKMASGDRWEDYLNLAVACDSKIPLGTKIKVVAPEEVKGTYICLDRGVGLRELI